MVKSLIQMKDAVGRTIVIASAVIFVTGAFILAGTVIRAQNPDGEPQKSPPPVADGKLPIATPVATPLGAGMNLSSAEQELRESPALQTMFDAIGRGDAAAFMESVKLAKTTCGARNSAVECPSGQTSDAVIFDDASSIAYVSVEATRDLFERLLSGGPRLALVTQYVTPRSDSVDYLLAFEIPPVTLGELGRRVLLPNDLEITGFGLKIASDSNTPVISCSPLTPTWGPLEWVQVYDPASQMLFAPRALDGFTRIDD